MLLGQKVIAIESYRSIEKGMSGVIMQPDHPFDIGYVGVEWNKDIMGHNLGGSIQSQRGFYIPKRLIKPINDSYNPF